MPYIEDNNGNHIIDDNGNKMTYSYSISNSNEPYREQIHIDSDGHMNTEDRHLIIKDGIDSNHAISKGQFDKTLNLELFSLKSDLTKLLSTIKSDLTISMENEIDESISILENKLTESFDTKLLNTKTEIINLIPSNDPVDPAIAENAIKELIQTIVQKSLKKFNKQIKGRVGKKSLTIHKTNYTWIKLLDVTEIDEITSLDEVLIQDMYIKSTDRYHNAKSSHTANAFTNLEFFYDAERENYYCYFDDHPSGWSMDCFFHYVKIPKEIAIEEEEEANE